MPNRARTVVAPIAPFVGLIETTQDALLIFEAARRAVIPRITRRLLESEKVLIKSGAVFVFDELESGIKRWTDGLVWSPSRILSNFIIYREANERTDRHPPRPRSKKGHQAITPHVSHHHHASSSSSHVKIVYPDELDADGSDLDDIVAISEEEVVGKKVRILRGPRPRRKTKAQTEAAGGIATQEDRERELVGSLTTSSKYKTQGLIKKTISVHINGVAQHLVSYYNMEDALSGKLRTPSSFPELASLSIHPDLLANDQFRYAPKTEIDSAGTLRYLGESDEAATSTSPPARKLAPPPPPVVRERRVLSAEPAALIPTPAPITDLLTSPIPHKRKRSTTISTLDDVPPVVLVIQDGRPLAAETLRLNPPADIVLSSTLLKGASHQLYPALSQDHGGPSVFVSRPEPRRTDFESEEEHDASISGALTPSSLQRTMASLASYELNGEHHGWKTGEGLENERLDKKRKWTESNQSSPEWDVNAYQHQAPSDSLLTAQYPPLRPSYDSSTSLDDFIHPSHLTPSSLRTNLPNPDFPYAPTPNPNESLSPSSASSSSNSSSLPFSRFNRPTFRTHSRQPSYQPLSPPKLPDRPHPQSSSYFPFNNQHPQLTKSLSLPPPQQHQQQQQHPRPASSSRTTPTININQFGSYESMSGAELMGQAELRRRKEENLREEAMMGDLLVESSPSNYGGGWPGLES